jgi:hypothetical protein
MDHDGWLRLVRYVRFYNFLTRNILDSRVQNQHYNLTPEFFARALSFKNQSISLNLIINDYSKIGDFKNSILTNVDYFNSLPRGAKYRSRYSWTLRNQISFMYATRRRRYLRRKKRSKLRNNKLAHLFGTTMGVQPFVFYKGLFLFNNSFEQKLAKLYLFSNYF